MKKPSCRPVRSRAALGALLTLLSAPWLGCSESTPADPAPVGEGAQTAEAVFSISLGEGSGQQKPGQVSAQAIRAQDVSRILVDVFEQGQQETPLFINFELTKAPEVLSWSGAIPFLPRGKALTFYARAYQTGDATPIFTGSTDQTLTGDRQSVIIRLAPRTNGEGIELPRITSISIPSEFISGQSGNISYSVEGKTGEALGYSITKDAQENSGTFFPATGTVTPLAQATTFVSQYSPDTVAADTDFVHTVRVTNPAGHSVSSTFRTRVKSPSTTNGVVDTNVQVLFNPVIAGLDGRRLEDTGTVVFTATVEDDGEPTALTYVWSFAPTGEPTPLPTLSFEGNVAVLSNYTTSLEGTLNRR